MISRISRSFLVIVFYWLMAAQVQADSLFVSSESERKPENPGQFQYLLDYAKDCRAIYFPDDWIFRQYPLAYVKTLPRSGLKFMILRHKDPGVQRIVFRGTSTWNHLFLGFKYFRDDENTEVDMHSGFLSVVNEFLGSEIDQIKKDVPISMTGHSMGGAVAVLAGMILERMGYQIKKIVTFGQPRVTDRQGADIFRSVLPITRVMHTTDIVPHIPPRFIGYSHLGEVIRLYGPFDFEHFDGVNKPAPRGIDSDEKKANELWNLVQSKKLDVKDIPELTAFPGSNFFRTLGKHGMKFYIRSMIANFGVPGEYEGIPEEDEGDSNLSPANEETRKP
jgi:hypothetical protein